MEESRDLLSTASDSRVWRLSPVVVEELSWRRNTQVGGGSPRILPFGRESVNRASRVRISFPHVMEEIEACPFSGGIEDLLICCAVFRKDMEEVVMNGSQGMRSPFLWPFVVVLLPSLEECILEILSFLMDENDILDELEL